MPAMVPLFPAPLQGGEERRLAWGGSRGSGGFTFPENASIQSWGPWMLQVKGESCVAGMAETTQVKMRDNEKRGDVILHCCSRPSGQLGEGE